MARIATHQLESVLDRVLETIKRTGARDDPALNDEIEILICQARIANLRMQIAAQMWVIDQFKNQIEHSTKQIDEFREVLMVEIAELRELEDKAALDHV